ncbi:MAG: hypothetical protein SFW67_12995 [Myxococcaceae bacterium]|nr:hypothetical protein [Myxococcaceae bacterium]
MRSALVGAALVLAACNMDVRVDPAGHRCNEIDACPPGYECVSFSCRAVGSLGGGAAVGGGFITGGGDPVGGGAGGGFAGGGALGGGGAVGGGGAAGGMSAGGGMSGGGTGGGDACANVTCSTVPPATCMGSVARSFSGPGRCEPSTGQCVFPSFELDCAPGVCSAGVCPLTVSQVGPRLRFPIRALDLAPGSTGSSALAVGANSQVASWNGTRWTTVNAPSAGQTLRAVNFVSSSIAWVVGDNRTAWRFDRGTQTFSSTPAPPLSGSARLVGVDGQSDTAVLVADDSGNWAKWNGTSWSSGAFPTTNASSFQMNGVWVDETGRERVAGSCFSSLAGARRSCVAYRFPATNNSWFIDTTMNETRSCVSIGPWVDVPASMGQDALCGFADNDSIRHGSQGSFVTNPGLVLGTGDGIVGITGGPPSGTTRNVWVLTASILGAGRLYRLTGSGATPMPVPQLDTFFGDEALSPSESAGVLVAEVDPVRNVNNVFYRRTTMPERTDALDLGLDFTGVTSFGGELTLLSSKGDLAIKRAGGEVFEFRRPPTASPQYNVEDADARNGTSSILVAGRDGSNQGLLARVTFAGYTRIASVPGTQFKGVCRASETEAFAVGTGGALFSIPMSGTPTRDLGVTTVNDLFAVDCPAPGEGVACGANGTVLVRSMGGAWAAAPLFPMAGKTLTTCKVVQGTVYVAGDGVFGRLSRGASQWVLLPSRPGLDHLLVRAPNDVFATSASNSTDFDVVRYDGTAWTVVLSRVSGAPGGGVQVGSRVVWGGSAGALVEGR